MSEADTETNGGTKADAGETYLSVDSINTFYDESHILHDLSFEMEQGDVIALLGRNGVGKTTTIRSIMGLTPPRSGTITFKGEDITNTPPHKILKKGIAFVPEDRVIFPNLTVSENLRVPNPRKDAPEELQFEIDDIYEIFPRLDERRTQLGASLSGGEQQMLTIGRSLMTNPDLLLMDEPSEGLAPQIVTDVMDVVTRINELGVSILVVEQNVRFANRVSNKHYILDKGRIQFKGDVEELSEARKDELLGASAKV